MTKLKTPSGLSVFLRQLVRNPKCVGAACPSSNRLAKMLAKQIRFTENCNTVIELGGGTGVITAALLAQGIPAEKLIVIERLSPLAIHLQKRFPGANIINGDASELNKYLSPDAYPINAIASSLPLRSLLSLPEATVKAIGEQIDQLLAPDGIYVQITYGIFNKPNSPSKNLRHVYSKYVWWNFPPARVDVFSKK